MENKNYMTVLDLIRELIDLDLSARVVVALDDVRTVALSELTTDRYTPDGTDYDPDDRGPNSVWCVTLWPF